MCWPLARGPGCPKRSNCNDFVRVKPGYSRDSGAIRYHAHDMGAGRKPTLVINPATDAKFGADAQLVIDEGITSIPDFVDRLREAYPRVAVHRREIFAEPVVIWYVYRDGQWVNARPGTHQTGAQADDQSTPGASGD